MAESIVESSTEAVLNVAKTERARVLHVDDDQAFLKVARQCLEMQGEFEVDTVSSVNEASEKLKKTDYDAIVCDYQMPGKDGLEFLKELRANGNTVPFIVFTGKGREEIAVKALNLGADRYVDKHGDPETVYCELAHDIRAALRSKRAEEAKRRSEDRYRTLLDSISDSVYVLDREWRHAVVNEAAASFTRIPREKLLGNKLTDLFPGVEKTPFFAAFRRVMETRKPETVDGKYVFEDGREGWYEVRVYPVPEGILCMSTDITSRKKTEEELEANEEKLRDVFACSPDAITVIDLNGNIVECNQETLDMLGYSSKDELIGRNGFTLVSEKDRERAKGNLTKALDHGSMRNIEYVALTKDGTELSAELSVCVVKDSSGIPMGFVSIVKDISERKKAEEEMRKSEVILRNVADSIIVTDLQGRITFWNEGASKIFGFSAEEILGENIAKVSKPKEREQVAPAQLEQVRKGVLFSGEWEGVKKDGEPVWLMLTTKLLKNSQGETVGMIGVGKDLTERRKAEEALRGSEEKWRSLAENAPNIIVIVDRVGTIEFINRTVVNARPEEIVGKSVYDFIDPEHHNVVKKIIEQVFQTGEGSRYEISGVGPKGSVAWYATHVGPIKRNGQVASVTLITTDFTERKKAEAALLLHETRLKSMLDLNRMTEASEKQIMDFALEEISKITWSQFAFIGLLNSDATVMAIHSWSKTAMKDCAVISKPMHFPVSEAGVWAEPIRQKKPVFINDYSALIPSKRGCPEGHVPITRFLGIPVFDGEHAVAIAAVANKKEDYDELDSRNLTSMLTDMWTLIKRKRTEEALREAMEGYRELAESISDMFFAMDKDFRYTYWNKACEEFTGISAKDAIGKSLTEVFPDVRGTGVEQFYKKALRTRQPQSYLNEYQLRGKDYVFEINAYPAKAGLSVFVKDVTERKKGEQQLRIKETAVASSVNGVAFADLEGKLTYVNSSFLEMWGYANENEVLGRPAEDFWSSKESAGEVVKALGHKGSWVGDLAAKKKDGSTFEVQLSASMVKDETGKPSCMMGSFLDVTERRKARQSLKESEEKYRGLVELAPDGVVAVNAEGTVTSANRSFLTLVGYDSEEGVIGKPFTELMTVRKEDIPRFQGMFMSLMKGESPSPSEFLYVRRDGTTRWAEVHPGLLIKDGHPVGAQAIMRDVSERKKAEEDLRNSEEQLSILFERAPDAYYLSDLKGNFVDGNKAAEKLTGYAKSELIGKSFMKLKLLPRNEVLKAAKLLAMNALGKSTGPDELVLNRKDGTQVPVEIMTHPIRIKGKTLVLGIARDITTRKKDEQAIQESQQRFEGLFRHNPEAAVYLGPDLCIQGINPRFEKLFGYALPEIKGKHIDDVVVPNDKREEAQALDSQAIQGYAHQNTWRRRKNGSPVPVSISAAPIIIEGRLAGYIGIYSDISELRSNQKKLEAMNEKLRVVGGLTRHDVRNKLSAITGNAYLLKKQLADNKEGLGKVRDMETAVSQVTRIFDFSRDYEMLGAEELAYIDVQKSVKEAVQLFQDLKGVRVLNECHGLTVLSDSLLRQLFYNLIDNSLKYGEKLSQIRIHCERAEGNQLRLIYEDDGVGISQDAKPKLFGEGYTTGKGSGYGLYLIRRMIEVYGWTIKETGEPGKGAKFVVTMPETNSNGKESYVVGR